MTRRDTLRIFKSGSLTTACVASLLLAGCGGGEEQTAARPQGARNAPTQSTPRAAPVVSIEELMAQMMIDERVQFPEDKAPKTTAERRAILSFFDGFARGDDQVVQDMIPVTDQYELARLVSNGQWSETTTSIEKIMLEASVSPDDQPCVMAVYEVNGEYQPQLWEYIQEGESFKFQAVSSPPEILNKLYGVDPIAIWYRILAEEEKLANTPDEDVELTQVVLQSAGPEETTGTGASRARSRGGNNPTGPVAPSRPDGPSPGGG